MSQRSTRIVVLNSYANGVPITEANFSIKTKTLPVAIAAFGGEDVSDWSISAAGAIGIMLPIVVIMLFVQRHLVRGLTIGAVKG